VTGRLLVPFLNVYIEFRIHGTDRHGPVKFDITGSTVNRFSADLHLFAQFWAEMNMLDFCVKRSEFEVMYWKQDVDGRDVELFKMHCVAAADKMKFSEHLAAHVTPEWHKQYITYEVSALVNYHDIALLCILR